MRHSWLLKLETARASYCFVPTDTDCITLTCGTTLSHLANKARLLHTPVEYISSTSSQQSVSAVGLGGVVAVSRMMPCGRTHLWGNDVWFHAMSRTPIQQVRTAAIASLAPQWQALDMTMPRAHGRQRMSVDSNGQPRILPKNSILTLRRSTWLFLPQTLPARRVLS